MAPRALLNSSSHSLRPLAAAVVSVVFGATWAALQWPWFQHADDARGSQAGAWLFIAYFLLLAVVLISRPHIGRWLGLATGALLIAFISLVLPAAVGLAQLSCQGAGWRCYVEGFAILGTGAALVLICFRRFSPERARGAA